MSVSPMLYRSARLSSKNAEMDCRSQLSRSFSPSPSDCCVWNLCGTSFTPFRTVLHVYFPKWSWLIFRLVCRCLLNTCSVVHYGPRLSNLFDWSVYCRSAWTFPLTKFNSKFSFYFNDSSSPQKYALFRCVRHLVQCCFMQLPPGTLPETKLRRLNNNNNYNYYVVNCHYNSCEPRHINWSMWWKVKTFCTVK
jgi:hypothetical protein